MSQLHNISVDNKFIFMLKGGLPLFKKYQKSNLLR